MDWTARGQAALAARIVLWNLLHVTIEAPTHFHAELPAHVLESLDGSVTLLTGDIAARHVPAVIEECEIRQVVDFVPYERILVFPMIQQRRRCREEIALLVLGLDLGMAFHTNRQRGDSGLGTVEGVGMAVEAGDLQFTGMKSMAVRDGLRRLIARFTMGGPQHIRAESAA